MRYKIIESSAIFGARKRVLAAFPRGFFDGIASIPLILQDFASWLQLTMYCSSDTKKELVNDKPRVARMVERWQYDSINMNTILSIAPRLSLPEMI